MPDRYRRVSHDLVAVGNGEKNGVGWPPDFTSAPASGRKPGFGCSICSPCDVTIVFLHSKRSLLWDGEYCLVSLMLERREEALHAAAA